MPLQEIHASDAKELKDIADTIARSHKVLLVTGAGISTSCGIPDFRSKDGLYNMIPEHGLPTPPSSVPSTPSRKRKAPEIEPLETPSKKRQAIDTDDEELPSSQSSTSSRGGRRTSSSPASRMSGQDLFHARVFQRADTTQVFNQFLAGFKQKLKDEVKETSKTHKFIRALRDGGRLMRCYTQNIDGLEEREGLCVDLTRGKGNKRRFMKKHYELPRPDQIKNTDYDGGCEVVQLHGELNNLRCTVCSTEEEWSPEASEILFEGAAPKCNTCDEKSEQRLATGKRGLTVGTLRPNIVLYGEEHPQNTLLSPLVPYDIASGPEVLIIMGTSLKVFGMQKIIRDFAKAVHSKKNGRVIFVNRTRPAESVWEGIIDDFIEMDCDDWVDDLRVRRPGIWLRQGELDLKEVKPVKRKRKVELDADHEAVATESKKVKIRHNSHISVDIPKQKSTSKKNTVPATPSRKKTNPRATKWKGTSPSNALKNLLSPLARAQRPDISPLTKSFKPLVRSEMDDPETINILPGTPPTPTFSPITPKTPSRFLVKTPSRLRIHQDVDEIEDGDGDGEVNDENAPVTPGDENNPIVVGTPKSNLCSKLFAAQMDGACDLAADTAAEKFAGSTWRRRAGRLFGRLNL